MGDEEQPLAAFAELLSKPEKLGITILSPQHENASQRDVLLKACRVLFQRVERTARMHASLLKKNGGGGGRTTLSGLEELYTGGSEDGDGDDDDDDDQVDAETLWGQIELQNNNLHALIKKSVKKLGKVADNDGDNQIKILDIMDSEEDDCGGSESEEEEEEEEGSEGGNDDDDDDDTKRIRERMERAMADMEEDDNSSASEEEDVAKKDRQTEGDEEESLIDPAAEELNDGFFDIHEMEAFADEEEEYLPDEAYGEEKPEEKKEDNRSFHQRQRDGDIEAGSDDDDDDDDDDGDFLLRRQQPTVRRRKYREDDEIDALYSMYETPRDDDYGDEDDGDDNDVINMTAADVFGKPNKNHFEKWKARKSKRKEKKDDDNDSWNDYNFNGKDENDETGWGRVPEKGDDQNMESSEEDEAVAMKGATDGNDDEAATEAQGSSSAEGGGKGSRLSQQTEQLEKEMLAEKPWQMMGESTSTSRPVNSLLESTPEFEVAAKMAPLVTEEHTADLEEVIRQRILNEDWDDVIPRELPDVGWHLKRGELPEVSQEKSKLGLGELYEREYLKKAVGYDVEAAEKETEEEKAKNEMRSLFANLCSKLDALSNYHFAPRPVAPDAEVKVGTKPAIAMEEVLPLHVSDARASAPEEIYAAKRGREGVLQGESELEQGDRKRKRAAKKAARRARRKGKLADEKLITRLQPGLGLDNPYEKRKMREELSVARARGKVTTGAVDGNDYGASGTFFKRMQQEAEQTIKGGRQPDEELPNERKKSSSSALKL